MKSLFSVFIFLILSSALFAQTYQVPEILYYKFNNGSTTTPNYALPGSGTNPAILMNMFNGPGGQFDSALVGNAGTGTTTYVNSGWNMDIGTSNWTIALWINNYPATSFAYIFGNDITTSFRCFSAGAAGTGNITLRGNGLANVNAVGVLPGPTTVHFVYDSSIPEIRTYINGVFSGAVGQTALNLSASVPFKVGSYGTAASIPAGSLLDEFRFYNRALSANEITDTWNQTLPYIVPVELVSFTGTNQNGNVVLNWSTATETNNSGFEVQRLTPDGWQNIGFVQGYGTTTERHHYSFIDNSVISGSYTYRLKQIDLTGTFEYSPEIQVEVVVVNIYSLNQNYPNPFNPGTTISFSLAVDSKVSVKIFDLLGQEVSSLVNTTLPAGIHDVKFNAGGLNSGVYFYQIDASGIDGSNFSSIKKMILAK